METAFHQDGARLSLATHACVSLLCLMATFPSACSFDASKLRAKSSRTPDGAIDYSAGPDAVQAGTGGAMEAGQVDSGATDRVPPTAGSDADLGLDGQDSSGANPDTALDGAIDYSAGATDQSPPDAGSDSALGQDGQDSSGANPDTNADANTGTGIVADGTYRVIARHSGKALDVYLSATADGSGVVQWTYNGGGNQRWALTYLGGNVYKILGVQSGRALEVATTSTADGTAVDIRTYTGAGNQQWTISALSGGYFRLTPVSSSGSTLDVASVSTTDGANVYQWTWLGGNNYNQQWTFQAP